MNFKKRVNGSWVDTPHYIHNTSTDTIVTLPADIYANDTTATMGLKGQMEQSGAPSPDSPIQPQECGERTANLFDEIYTNIISDIPRYKSVYVGNGTFTLSTNTPMYGQSAVLFLLAGNVSSGASTNTNGVSVGISRTVTAIDGYVTIAYRWYNGADPRDYQTMLNTGSQPLPYEPYGIKIPIPSASTTTNIYLGEVQTTRRVKKLVLTGEENIEIKSGNAKWYIPIADMRIPPDISVIAWYCSHYQAVANNASWISYDYMISWSSADFGSSIGLRIRDIDLLTEETVAYFKAYLAQQYANGTPVTVWYVLSKPTTGIVNEPLRKIGDYADEVSGITIPVTAGANTISVDTQVQPSEASVNYKGWHSLQSVHERESGAWT